MQRTMTDEVLLPKEAQIEIAARELLKNHEVASVLESIDSSVHYTNRTGEFTTDNPTEKTPRRKAERFLGLDLPLRKRLAEFLGRKLGKEHFLRYFWRATEGEPEINKNETRQLKRISQKLAQKQDTIDEIVSTLLKTQEINMKNRKVADTVTTTEQEHITQVVGLCKTVFPNLPILQLAAAVHDSYKHVAPQYNELGLHELTSTAFGTTLVEVILKKYAEQLSLKSQEIELIAKLVKRIIFTHGDREFIDLNAEALSGIVSVKQFQAGSYSGLYIDTVKTSIVDGSQSEVQTMIAALNYLDALTGTNYTSFIKYHGFYKAKDIAEYPDLAGYFHNAVFASFNSNMNMQSGLFLQRQGISSLNSIVQENTRVQLCITHSLSGNLERLSKIVSSNSQSKIENARQKLNATHELMQRAQRSSNEEELNRLKTIFDIQIETFIKAAHEAVTTSRQK